VSGIESPYGLAAQQSQQASAEKTERHSTALWMQWGVDDGSRLPTNSDHPAHTLDRAT
jgi:hypothetical protein